MRSYLFVLVALLGIASCGERGGGEETNGNGDNGNGSNGEIENGEENGGENGLLKRILSAVEPESGPMEGGTGVELIGEGFSEGLRVKFGNLDCVGLVIISFTRASCYTPTVQNAGKVDVMAVWPDGHSSVLRDGFTYVESDVELNPVEYCHLQWPDSLEAELGQKNLGPVFGWVHHPGITDGEGKDESIIAQIGLAPVGALPSDDGWTWFPAAYNERKANDNGELVNYEYMGFLNAPEEEGFFDFTYRFRLAEGGPWTWCNFVDAGGSEIPYDSQYAGKMNITEKAPLVPAPVDYCHVQYPEFLFAHPNEENLGPVYGWVYHAGITDGEGNQDKLEAQLGLGGFGSDPREENGNSWIWINAVFNERKQNDFGEFVNYEYQTVLNAPSLQGSWNYAYRFRLSPDGPWTYCHLSEGGGSNHEQGYDPDHAGVLNVQADEPVFVTYCHLQHPLTINVAVQAETGDIYGVVYHDGVTTLPEEEGALELLAEVGFGPDGSDPRNDGSNWNWFEADFNTRTNNQHDELVNYEYKGNFSAPAVTGPYDYAYRFRLKENGDWLYCHSLEHQGSDHEDGYNPDFAGKMTVTGE